MQWRKHCLYLYSVIYGALLIFSVVLSASVSFITSWSPEDNFPRRWTMIKIYKMLSYCHYEAPVRSHTCSPAHTNTRQPNTHCAVCFPPTSHWISLPTFVVEVLPLLARFPLDGRPAVHHVNTPLHFHVLLAFLEGLNEKLSIISPDQACLEKRGLQISAPLCLQRSVIPLKLVITVWFDQLEDPARGRIRGMTQVDPIWGPSSASLWFTECRYDFIVTDVMMNNVSVCFHLLEAFKGLMENCRYTHQLQKRSSKPLMKLHKLLFDVLTLDPPSCAPFEWAIMTLVRLPTESCFLLKVSGWNKYQYVRGNFTSLHSHYWTLLYLLPPSKAIERDLNSKEVE